MSSVAALPMYGLAMRFEVVIDGYDLGAWTSCRGLAVTFKHDRVLELGEHTLTGYIPGRVEYSPVSLGRAMVKSDWDKTKAWLEMVGSAPWLLADSPSVDIASNAGGFDVGTSTGKITLRDAHLDEVATWELQGVLPAAWKGPQFDANGKAVAIETLDLVHGGFLDCWSV
jgi:phage tail-like protein